ncbi:hypothetical protein BDV10DRAFT_184504 [Aspergillus recurvatus]
MSNSNVGCAPAAFTAELLDNAQVPNVLWGWWAVSLVGIHGFFPQEVESMMPDDKFNAPVMALKISNRFRHCTDPACWPVADDNLRLSTDTRLSVGRNIGGTNTGSWADLCPAKVLRPTRLYEVRNILSKNP